MKKPIRSLLLPLLITSSAVAQNLIADGSLEIGAVPSCSQGLLPAGWFNTSGTADTYSLDCATHEGLPTTAGGHFASLPAAHDGLRFIAGWSSALETFGTTFTQPLVTGEWYEIRAWFTKSLTLGGDGSYAIWLSMGPTMTGAVEVAQIGSNDQINVWNEDVANFQAPGPFTHLILEPIGNNYYTGSDSWSCTQAGGPEAFCASNPNSTGNAGQMGFNGSVQVADNQFELTATGLPSGYWGQFFYGTSQAQTPFGNGFLCIGDEHRLPPHSLSSGGTVSSMIDLTSNPIVADALPGAELYFQFWFRDPMGGGAGFNTTDGLIVRLQ